GEVIAYMEKDGTGATAQKTAPPEAKPAKAKAEAEKKQPAKEKSEAERPAAAEKLETRVMPAAERALAERGLKPGDVEATGPGGRLLKEDGERRAQSQPPPAEPKASTSPRPDFQKPSVDDREEEIVPMSRLRRTVAERLVAAQQAAALLTTFNEI